MFQFLSSSPHSLCFVLISLLVNPSELSLNHSKMLPPRDLLYNNLPSLTSQIKDLKIPLPPQSPPELNPKADNASPSL